MDGLQQVIECYACGPIKLFLNEIGTEILTHYDIQNLVVEVHNNGLLIVATAKHTQWHVKLLCIWNMNMIKSNRCFNSCLRDNENLSDRP